MVSAKLNEEMTLEAKDEEQAIKKMREWLENNIENIEIEAILENE